MQGLHYGAGDGGVVMATPNSSIAAAAKSGRFGPDHGGATVFSRTEGWGTTDSW